MLVDWRRFWRRLGIALNFREPPNVPSYGWSYLDHLVAVYVNLNKADSRADALIFKSRNTPDDLTWGDIYLLENIVFSMQPEEVVVRSAWALRARFRDVAGPVVYGRYLASGVPTDTDTPAKFALLRADLTRVLDILHWYYSLIPLRERIRTQLTRYCSMLVIFYSVALVLSLGWCYIHHTEYVAMIVSIVYLGIIGGFVSSQRRMQKLSLDGDPLVSVFGFDSSGYYLWLSPLLGGIFAIILYFMFVAGVFRGIVFPEFFVSHPPPGNGLSFFAFTWNTVPVTSEEYAKLFVWSFLAGFAERLVPDSLDRLGSKLDPKETTGVPAAATFERPSPAEAGAKPPVSDAVVDAALHSGQAPPAPPAGSGS
jgi:hypothetical protein